MASSAASTAPKAAVLVIGNEVLNGSIADANTPWLARFLYSRGVDLVRAEYVPDDVADIAETVQRLRARVGAGGFVFTSGGIGPTHDDVTYEAVAAALGVPLECHEPTVAKMVAHYAGSGQELNEARLRMATLPAGCEVLETPGLWVPLAVVGGDPGVYVLPGIPRLFKAMVEGSRERFAGPAHHAAEAYTLMPEGDLAAALTGVAAAHPGVSIGSYPNCDPAGQERYKVRISMESRDADALSAAMAAMRESVPTVDL